MKAVFFTPVRELLPHVIYQYIKSWLYTTLMILTVWFLSEIVYAAWKFSGDAGDVSLAKDFFENIHIPFCLFLSLGFVIRLIVQGNAIKHAALFVSRESAEHDTTTRSMIQLLSDKAGFRRMPAFIIDNGFYYPTGFPSPGVVLTVPMVLIIPINFLLRFSPREQLLVLAHEISHVKHCDIVQETLMMSGSIVLRGYKVIVSIAFLCTGTLEFFGWLGVLPPLIPTRELFLLGIALVIIVLIAFLYRRCRYTTIRCREYLADAGVLGLLGWQTRHEYVAVLLAIGERAGIPLFTFPDTTWSSLLRTHPNDIDRAKKLGIKIILEKDGSILLE